MKRLAVFCGSAVGLRPIHAENARDLGRLMVAHNIELVFGAGHIGLMGIVADSVLSAGGRAIGVIPQSLVDRELAHRGLTELHIVETMHQRKSLMADLSDAFLALPGGYGTLDELFEILTWAQLGIHRKPVGLLNVDRFFDPLLAWVHHAATEGFIKPKHIDLLTVAATVPAMLDALLHHHPAPPVIKWAEPEDR